MFERKVPLEEKVLLFFIFFSASVTFFILALLLKKQVLYYMQLTEKRIQVNDSKQTIGLINAITSDDEQALSSYYDFYRKHAYEYMCRSFSDVSEDIVENIFHDKLMAFCEYVKSGKFRIEEEDGLIIGLQKGSALAFLRATMRFDLLKYKTDRKRNSSLDPDDYKTRFDTAIDAVDPFKNELTIEEVYAKKAFEQLGKACQDVIKGRVVDALRYSVLIERLNEEQAEVIYAEEKNIRVKNFRCLKKLRKNYESLINKCKK